MRTLAFAVLLVAAAPACADKPVAPRPAAAPDAGGKVEIKVTEAGFEPREVKARAGHALTMVFTRVTDQTCITAVDVPDAKVKGFELPLDKAVSLTITPARPGVMAFHCTAMGMGDGKIVVE